MTKHEFSSWQFQRLLHLQLPFNVYEKLKLMNIGSTKLVKAIIKDLRRTGTKSKNLKGAACIVLIRVFLDFKFRVSA